MNKNWRRCRISLDLLFFLPFMVINTSMIRHMIDECHAHGVIHTPCVHRPNEGLENDGDVPFRHPLDLLSARGLDHI